MSSVELQITQSQPDQQLGKKKKKLNSKENNDNLELKEEPEPLRKA